jgi:hypothetical protein
MTLALLLLLSTAAPADVCVRRCLATPLTLGLDDAERGAVGAALARALDAAPCAPTVVVDDDCFGDDACLAALPGADGLVATRVVRAAGQVQLAFATPRAGGVLRGRHAEPWLSFLAAGALDDVIARGACAPADAATSTPSTSTTTTTTTSTAPTTSTTTSTTTTPAQAAATATTAQAAPPASWLLVGGGATVGVGVVGVIGAEVALEGAQTPGALKETAYVVGWTALLGVVAGAAAAGVGAYFLFVSPGDVDPGSVDGGGDGGAPR